jgi:hypothetical protein
MIKGARKLRTSLVRLFTHNFPKVFECRRKELLGLTFFQEDRRPFRALVVLTPLYNSPLMGILFFGFQSFFFLAVDLDHFVIEYEPVALTLKFP